LGTPYRQVVTLRPMDQPVSLYDTLPFNINLVIPTFDPTLLFCLDKQVGRGFRQLDSIAVPCALHSSSHVDSITENLKPCLLTLKDPRRDLPAVQANPQAQIPRIRSDLHVFDDNS
jgi:hypothetical protein